VRPRYIFSLQVSRMICNAVSCAMDLFSCTSRSLRSFSAHAHADSNESNGASVGLARCDTECQASLSSFQAPCQAPLATKKWGLTKYRHPMLPIRAQANKYSRTCKFAQC
jgi:hypothetical protein